MKKILITAIGAELGGAVRHLTNLLPELGESISRYEYVVLVRDSFPEIKTPNNVRIQRVPDWIAGSWLLRLVYDVVVVPWMEYRGRFAALVSILNTGPIWLSAPHILFQRNSLYFCPYYLANSHGLRAAETY